MPGRDAPQHPYRAFPGWLKHELKSELDKSRIGARHCAGYHAKVCGSNAGVGWRKLRAVEEIKELRPELQSQFVIGAELSPLEQREVKVVHAGAAKIGVGAGFITKGKVRR